jgi:Sec-independent protein translocase protein TatA
MNQPAAANADASGKRRQGAAGWVRALVPGLAFFAAGAALSAWWFLQAPPSAAAPDHSGPPALSAATKAVLRHLESPVEIRFYSLLDPASVGDSGREFSGRVEQLLCLYEQEAGGKISIARVNSFSASTANAAVADGIKPFNMDKGDACYLGLVVVCNGHKASLASLAPEWEQALEPDLSRAIAGVDLSVPHPPPAAKADKAALAAVRQAIPNLDSVSVEDGSRQLRAASIAEFKKTAQEMQAKVQQAEDRFIEAQNSQSEEDRQAALTDLQRVKNEQTEKLKEIALESKAQVEALQQLKGAAH